MPPGDSTVIELKKPQVFQPSWWRSRSTVICLSGFLAILGIDYICKRAGFFDAVIATISINIVKDVLVSVFSHQGKPDETKDVKSTTTTP